MKKVSVWSIAVLTGALILFGLFAVGVQAGRDSDAWTRVHAYWPDYGYYKASPNGVVHEKFFCDSNWQNCVGDAIYFPTSKFENPVLDTPCGAGILTLTWEGTVEYLDDEGDASDFLTIGETYWFCETIGVEIFRSSE